MSGLTANKTNDNVEPFAFGADDPLAAEHAAIGEWLKESAASLANAHFYQTAELNSLPTGQRILAATPDLAARYVHAAALQMSYWDHLVNSFRSPATPGNPQGSMQPGAYILWSQRQQARNVISDLMRRALPLGKGELLALLAWCNEAPTLSRYFAPIVVISRALERYAAKTPLDPELKAAVARFADILRASNDSDAKRCAGIVQPLCASRDGQPSADEPAPATRPSPSPAPAGSPEVLDPLKRFLGVLPNEPLPVTTIVGLDRFPLRDDSPLRAEHQILTNLIGKVKTPESFRNDRAASLAAIQELLSLPPDGLGRALLAAIERQVDATFASSAVELEVTDARNVAGAMKAVLTDAPFSLSRAGLFDFLLYLSADRTSLRWGLKDRIGGFLSQLEAWTAESPLSEGERYVLSLLRTGLIVGALLGTPSEQIARLNKLIEDSACFFLVPGEVWSDAVNEEISALKPLDQRNWAALLTLAISATAARPTAKWLKSANQLIDKTGPHEIYQALERWLPLVPEGQVRSRLGPFAGDLRATANTMFEENATCLRGLLWLIPLLKDRLRLAHKVTGVALSAYKKIPGFGPRAIKVGNAAIYVLSELGTTEAVGQLALLKVRVKFGTAQKEIEKAFNAAAEALELPRDQIEEMAVPTYGLEEVGLRRESFGDYRAELVVNGSTAELRWFDGQAKALKSVPAKVKNEHNKDLKELQQALKDVQAMLPAQRDRLDSLFLSQKRWPLATWRERYLEHPLVGTIAGRLLWCVDGESALFVDGHPTDVQGRAMPLAETTEVTLWHPVGRPIEEITSWRCRLEELGVTQPFKQAHREVYLLTDAERATRTYSNRFAAHILRQHQFNALCAARGWRNKLRLLVDDVYHPPCKELPLWGLRAEYWVEGIGDNYGTDTNETGVFLRLTSDQVRFYRTQAAANRAHAGGGGYTTNAHGPGDDNVNEPIPLEEIPPLVLSEIMRDVDLFVGVASVGNDPTWQNGGPDGRYQAYWLHYSFGELSGSAATRKAVLEQLVPRLKIAERCSFSDRFLIVRGKKRTYKIHLGSGNILMEPNDQYLCIVPDARSRANQGDLYLPFEGDSTLSIIISKALLLAEDDKIKDQTIVRQINDR